MGSILSSPSTNDNGASAESKSSQKDGKDEGEAPPYDNTGGDGGHHTDTMLSQNEYWLQQARLQQQRVVNAVVVATTNTSNPIINAAMNRWGRTPTSDIQERLQQREQQAQEEQQQQRSVTVPASPVTESPQISSPSVARKPQMIRASQERPKKSTPKSKRKKEEAQEEEEEQKKKKKAKETSAKKQKMVTPPRSTTATTTTTTAAKAAASSSKKKNSDDQEQQLGKDAKQVDTMIWVTVGRAEHPAWLVEQSDDEDDDSDDEDAKDYAKIKWQSTRQIDYVPWKDIRYDLPTRRSRSSQGRGGETTNTRKSSSSRTPKKRS